MPRISFFKIFSITLLILLAAGCIDDTAVTKDEAGTIVPNVETVVSGEIERFVADQVENLFNGEEEAVSGENAENGQPADDEHAVDNEKPADNKDSPSPEIPAVPTYAENESNVVYPREYRVLSLNFKRAIDPDDEGVSQEVQRITGKESGYNLEDVCTVFDYVNGQWEYRYDKNAEFFFGASQTIRSSYEGDCDDYSIVMSALMGNMGFNTRIVTVRNVAYGHAYPEIYIGDDPDTAYGILSYVYERYSFAESIWYSERELENGETQYWLNLDWSGSNGYLHPGGAYLEGTRVAYYPGGLVEF